MKLKILCFILIVNAIYINAQVSQKEQNLQKYWRFKERLKNFVVTGDCQGCSLISTGREINGAKPTYSSLTYNSNTVVSSGHLNYPDETQHLGVYIGTLASEYGVLIEHLEFIKAEKTLTELAYALEAFNRLSSIQPTLLLHQQSLKFHL